MKRWTSTLLVIVLGACGQKSELPVDNASRQFCNCFSAKTTGSVDDKLSPCLQEIVDKKNKEWQESGLINQDTLTNRTSKFSLDLMIDMVRTCDNYFVAINSLYDNGYPLDTTELNRKTIGELSNKIKVEPNTDSTKSLLHKKVYRLIQAREFELALQSIDSIKSLDNTDYGANLASAYIFNQRGQYDNALVEIDRAVEFSGNGNLKLYAEITKRKRLTSKK